MPVSVYERLSDLCEHELMISENCVNEILDGLCEKERVLAPVVRCEIVYLMHEGALGEVNDMRNLFVNENAMIEESRYVFVPVYIHSDQHYVLYVADKIERTLTYYDSLHCGQIRGGNRIVGTVRNLTSIFTITRGQANSVVL